ncbi:MAG: hypothetical protein QM771_18215 [Nitrospira sp.]
MIPSTFIELETLPLTVNGKVDRKALQVAADSRASKVELTSQYLAPRTPTEQVLADIWGEILQLKTSVCMTTSLNWAGIRSSPRNWSRGSNLCSASRYHFDRSSNVERSATLAEVITQAQAGGKPHQGESAYVITRAKRGIPLPLSFAQERMWFSLSTLAGSRRLQHPGQRPQL